MADRPTTPGAARPGELALRRQLVAVAAVTAVFGGLHFVDHVIRGRLVVDRGLDPAWDHSGWPFEARFSPFTISLLVVSLLLLGGIVFTLRGRLWAGYWLGVAIVLCLVVVQVHFLGGARSEFPSVIYDTYDSTYDQAAPGIAALADLAATIASLLVMAVNAVWVRRNSGHW
jgi:cytochrome bd-type quinol oxidase subunit 2